MGILITSTNRFMTLGVEYVRQRSLNDVLEFVLRREQTWCSLQDAELLCAPGNALDREAYSVAEEALYHARVLYLATAGWVRTGGDSWVRDGLTASMYEALAWELGAMITALGCV